MNMTKIKRCIFLIGITVFASLAFLVLSADRPSKASVAEEMMSGEDDVKPDGENVFVRIQDMSDEQILSWLDEYRGNSPNRYFLVTQEQKDQCIRYLRGNIERYEESGSIASPYGMVQYGMIAKDLQIALDRYYEKFGISLKDGLSNRYDPVQNTFAELPYGYTQFNCYAYAIGYPVACNPGNLSGIYYNGISNISVYTLATYVKSDLKSQNGGGYSCVKITGTRPDYSSLQTGQQAVCIRKGFSSVSLQYDYHFMKLTDTGWYHKPGGTAVLRHNVNPDGYSSWLSEYTLDGNTWYLNDLTYTGMIYYILYKSSHTPSGTVRYTGNNYHSGAFHYYEYEYICSGCGEAYGAHYERVLCPGPPCPTPVNKQEPEEQ